MTPPDTRRLQHLCEVVALECRYLLHTDRLLFATPMDEARTDTLKDDPALAERVDAFVARYARLQDTVGDKLLPEVLRLSAEPMGSVLDNLLRAEKLGWLTSAEEWILARRLRNEMVHEYVRTPSRLALALQAGHAHVTLLVAFGDALRHYAQSRFSVDS